MPSPRTASTSGLEVRGDAAARGAARSFVRQGSKLTVQRAVVWQESTESGREGHWLGRGAVENPA
jgi:hypothetical protein